MKSNGLVATSARNIATLVLLFIAPMVVGAGQSRASGNLQLNTLRFTPTDSGYKILVIVKNAGTRPVVLAEAATRPLAVAKGETPGSGILQSLDIEQWSEKLGWQSVGPCRDVVPGTVITMSSGETIKNWIDIGDTSHGWRSSACLRGVEHLGGKIRAILYSTYDSEELFQKRRPLHKNIVSPAIELPPMKR